MSDSSDTGEQLVSFFLYSLFIYPITNYIVSPHRKYPRWKAAIYAILFLATVATLHLWYENSEKGPNYYQLLQVRRDMPMSTIKKAYRSLSLELHPDKNKAPDAAEQFRKIQHAFDVITDKSKRRDYELLGEHGVKLSNQIVIDQKYLLLQLIIYYASSLIFAFLMTFSEPTGDAFQLSIFGLSSMLLVELLLILKEVDLPAKLFPYMTSHEFVNLLHRLFPAFMNGCRCITGAFFQDRKALREKAMEELHNTMKDITMKCDQLSHSMIECIQQIYQKRKEANPFLDKEGEDDPFEANDPSIGIIERVLRQKERQFQASKEGREGTVEAAMQASLKLIADPKELAKKMTMNKNSSNGWILFRNLLIYLIARFVLIKSAK